MNFDETAEFTRELKSLTKRWDSLHNDLEKVKRQIETLYMENSEINMNEYRQNFFNGKRATILRQSEDNEVVKMRLDCASLGNKSLLRLIFIYIKTGSRVLLVELYSKNDKSREDTTRIKRYLNAV